jgi:hypothetical protein
MITKITAPASPATSVDDWSAMVNQLSAIVLNADNPRKISGSTILQSAFFNIGGSLFIAGADTSISGTASNYVKLTVSGSTATPSFVTDLTGVSWNAAYRGYYDSTGNCYEFDELKALAAGAITTPYRFAIGLASLGTNWPAALVQANLFNGTVAGEIYTNDNTHASITFGSTSSEKWVVLAKYFPGVGNTIIRFVGIVDGGTSIGSDYPIFYGAIGFRLI